MLNRFRYSTVFKLDLHLNRVCIFFSFSKNLMALRGNECGMPPKKMRSYHCLRDRRDVEEEGGIKVRSKYEMGTNIYTRTIYIDWLFDLRSTAGLNWFHVAAGNQDAYNFVATPRDHWSREGHMLFPILFMMKIWELRSLLLIRLQQQNNQK